MNDMSSLTNDQKTNLRITSLESELSTKIKLIEELRDREANVRKAYDKVVTQAQVWQEAFEYMADKLVEK